MAGLWQLINTKRYVLLMGWLALFVVHHACAVDDLPGSADLAQITRYPNSWIVDFSQQQVPEYRLATGSMKKINGVVAPESQRYVAGQLTRITYRMPSGHSSADVFEYFSQQFDGKRFLDEVNPSVNDPSMRNDVLGVTGHVKGFGIRINCGSLFEQLSAVHLGHDHIGENRV